MNVAPTTFTVAESLHRAAMRLHEALDDRQSEAEARVHACRRRVGLAKRVEHRRQELLRDTRTGVRHVQFHCVSPGRSLEAHVNRPALRRELHRVREKIPNHLLEPCRVSQDPAGRIVKRRS